MVLEELHFILEPAYIGDVSEKYESAGNLVLDKKGHELDAEMFVDSSAPGMMIFGIGLVALQTI